MRAYLHIGALKEGHGRSHPTEPCDKLRIRHPHTVQSTLTTDGGLQQHRIFGDNTHAEHVETQACAKLINVTQHHKG